jgi:hypothetical protein
MHAEPLFERGNYSTGQGWFEEGGESWKYTLACL